MSSARRRSGSRAANRSTLSELSQKELMRGVKLLLRRDDDEVREASEARVREVDDALVGDGGVARAGMRRDAGLDGQLAFRIDAGDGQLSRPGRAGVEEMRRRRVVDVVHSVAGIDRGEHFASAGGV